MVQEKTAETGTGLPHRRASHAGRFTVWLGPRRPPFWLFIVVLIYALAGFFLAPRLVERAATKAIAGVDRSLSIGEVKINPFVLDLELEDVVLRDTDGELLFASANAYANFQLSSLFRQVWTFREFRLLEPRLNLERYRTGDDRVSSFLKALASEAENGHEAELESTGLPPLAVQQLELSNGRVMVTDHFQDQEIKSELGPINVTLSDLSTLPGQTGRQTASIATHSGGAIAWSGQLQLSPLLLQGRLTLSGQGLEDVYRYLNVMLPFSTQVGDTSAVFDYRIAMASQGGLELAVENMVVEARDIRIRLADGGSEVIHLPQLKLTGGALRWPENKFRLDHLAIDAAQLNIARLQDGSLDWQGLLPAASAAASSSQAGDAAAGAADDWDIDLQQLVVTGAAISVMDFTMEPAAAVSVNGLTLSVSAISNRADALFPTQLEFQLAEGGGLDFDGKIGVLPAFSVAGTVTVKEVALALGQPWITDFAHVAIASGTASVKGELVHGPQETASYQGSLRIDGFTLTDTNRGEQLLGVQSLVSDRIEFNLDHRSLETSVLKLTRPYGRIAIAPDKTTNLAGLLIENNASEGLEKEEAAARPLKMTLGGLELDDASLDFSDRSLPLPFAAAIHAMNGTVSTLSNVSAEPATILLEGQVNEYGLARISGSINAWSPAARSDVKVVFRNLETANLSPYTIGIAGYKIDGGQLDLDLDYQIRQGKMKGANKIISRKLKLGDRIESPGGASLPLGLAVALLTDSQGVIDLDLPVSGDLNDPQFRLGGVVAKAILGSIGKIVTSPFRLLGKLVGVDAKDFGTLNFTPGSAAISPPDREKLVKLAAAMRQRPELALEVGGVYAADSDLAALQAIQLDAELMALMQAQKPNSEELLSVTRRRALETLFKQAFPETALEQLQMEYQRAAEDDEQSPPQPALDETAYLAGLRQRLIAREQVADAELARLAGLRADAVVAALQDSSEGSGLSISRAETQAVKATPSGEIPLELQVSAGGRSK